MNCCVNNARKAITQALKTYVTTLENGKKYQPSNIDGWYQNYLVIIYSFL